MTLWRNSRNQELRERAAQVIPGGMYGHMSTRLLPPEFPQFFTRGKGGRIWDVDDNEYIDFMCAYGPNLLGYCDAEIDLAAQRQQSLGDALNGPGEVMVELAELFVDTVSHASWAMFCKNGTDATSIAMVLARAHTGKKIILVADGAYHGAAPWCVPAVLSKGTLPEDRAYIVYYSYNDAQSLSDAFKKHAGDIAAVFATPFRHEVFDDQFDPDLEYAQTARRLCDETNALLVIDDVRAGFRIARDCSWAKLGIQPDLSCWGKCFANGYPISAVLGSEHVRESAASIFVTGSFWFSAVPMAAGVATLRRIKSSDYLEQMQNAGQLLRDGLHESAKAHGFSLRQTGPVQMPQILFDDDPHFSVGYAWAAEALKHGAYFHPYHNMFLSSAHTSADIAVALEAANRAFEVVRRTQHELVPPAQLAQLFAAAQGV
jgi:glutamate-1-semialdehyde 2,1-aminomutase